MKGSTGGLTKNAVKKIASSVAVLNVQSVVFKETLANGDTIHRWNFTNGTFYDMLTHAGVASWQGKFLNLAQIQSAFPNGVANTQFIITYDEQSASNPNGTGVVSLFSYDSSAAKWNSIKLNQAIPVGTSGDNVGFSGNTAARIALLVNADWNTKEYLYYDSDLHILMLYKSGAFIQYNGQAANNVIPSNPADGDLMIGTERIYTWDNTNKFWKIQISSYIRKYAPNVLNYLKEQLNGAELRISLEVDSSMILSIYQNTGMDSLKYSISDDISDVIVLAEGQSTVILSNIPKGIPIPMTVFLKNDGYGIAVTLLRLANTVFLLNFQKLITGDASTINMTTAERKLFKNDVVNPHNKKMVYDTDLDISLMFRPKAGSVGTFIQDIGQREIAQFPVLGLTDGQKYFSSHTAIEYTYHLDTEYWSCPFGPNQGLDTDDNVGFNSVYAESTFYAPDITQQELLEYNNYLYNKLLKPTMTVPKSPTKTITEMEGLMFKVTDGASGWYQYSSVAKQIVPWLYGVTLDSTVAVETLPNENNSTSPASTAFVHSLLSALVGSSPAALDTLKELATALGNDANFSTTMVNALALKAPLANPVFTGTPTAPTAPINTNSEQLATCKFVLGQGAGDIIPHANKGTGDTGTSGKLSRADHEHPIGASGSSIKAGLYTLSGSITPAVGNAIGGSWDNQGDTTAASCSSSGVVLAANKTYILRFVPHIIFSSTDADAIYRWFKVGTGYVGTKSMIKPISRPQNESSLGECVCVVTTGASSVTMQPTYASGSNVQYIYGANGDTFIEIIEIG
jgi:hypothetical protein